MLIAALRVLAQAESEILLLSRSHPRNWQTLRANLYARWSRGERCEPAFDFQPPPDLGRLRAELARAVHMVVEEGPWGVLLAERAAELESDAALTEQIGRPGFRRLAQKRYLHAGSKFEHDADGVASDWSRAPIEEPAEQPVATDDAENPLSLYNRLRAEMKACAISMPIRIDERLAAVAAVDRECVWIRGKEQLRPIEARRVALHEIQGHALRRVRAREPENALSSSGFSSSDEDEEGRALWLEDRAEFLTAPRKCELSWRHLTARACQRGATFVEAVEELVNIGCPLRSALNIGLRIWRGGGLARESIYLRAYVYVRDILDESPNIERWMRRGRYSTSVAARLAKGELAIPLVDASRG